jgi:hypothetical protein
MGKYAIFIVLALVLTVTIYSNSIMNTYVTSTKVSVTQFNQSQARNIAISAANIAIRKITIDNNFELPTDDGATNRFPASGFEEWVELGGAYSLSATNVNKRKYVLNATGLYEGETYTVEVHINHWTPEQEYAAFGSQALKLTTKNNGKIVGNVGTNGSFNAVDPSNKTTIEGSVHLGKGHGRPNPKPSSIKGSVGNLKKNKEYKVPPFPTYPVTTSSQSISNNATIYAENFSSKKLNLDLPSGKTLNINVGSNKYNIRSDNFKTQGSINIIGTGSLSLFVSNELKLEKGSVNFNGNPSQLTIHYNGTQDVQLQDVQFSGMLFVKNNKDVIVKNSSNFKGTIMKDGTGKVQVLDGTGSTGNVVIYAPQADVELKMTSNKVFTGNIVGRTVELLEDNIEIRFKIMDLESFFPLFDAKVLQYWK